MNRTQAYQPIKKEFIPLEKNQEVKISVEGLREIQEATAEESQIPTAIYNEDNGIVPVPIIVNRTETHNSGDVAKQGSVRFNALGIVPFVKKLFSKKEKPQMAVAPKPLPEGELVISFYDSTKELLSTEILSLSEVNNWETLSFATKTEEKGYISAKIQGTSSAPVKFDDFSIQLKSLYSAKLYQENHYYPFGMNMKGLESSDKQSVHNKKEHKFQFNAQTEREESFGLFWDETPFRNYDMQLGRLWGVDKLSEVTYSLTPFHYSMNNPLSLNDPSGLVAEGVEGIDSEVLAKINNAWSNTEEGEDKHFDEGEGSGFGIVAYNKDGSFLFGNQNDDNAIVAVYYKKGGHEGKHMSEFDFLTTKHGKAGKTHFMTQGELLDRANWAFGEGNGSFLLHYAFAIHNLQKAGTWVGNPNYQEENLKLGHWKDAHGSYGAEGPSALPGRAGYAAGFVGSKSTTFAEAREQGNLGSFYSKFGTTATDAIGAIITSVLGLKPDPVGGHTQWAGGYPNYKNPPSSSKPVMQFTNKSSDGTGTFYHTFYTP